ncbi:MAG: Mur ligase family protein [Alphaproteobacteria bacterium]
MRIASRASFPGPNLFGPASVVRVAIELGALDDRTLAVLGPAMAARLSHSLGAHLDARWLATERSIREALQGGPPGGLADAIAALARGILEGAQDRSTFVSVRRIRPGVAQVVLGAEWMEVGLAALDYALAAVLDALPTGDPACDAVRRPIDRRGANDAFQAVVARYRLHALTRTFISHAGGRGVPYQRLWPEGGTIRLGHGSRGVRLMASTSDRTSRLADRIVADKAQTSGLLRAHGIPVPAFRLAADADEAVTAATEIGFPVVVKPTNGQHGTGVALGLGDAEAVRAAFARAAAIGPVMVERELFGDDHRILVVDGRMVAASRRRSARVVGDGRRTVGALLRELNADPRRSGRPGSMLVKVPADADVLRVLAEQGKDLSSVPAPDEVVLLRRTANVSSGGSMEDVTPLVHRECRLAAERATILAGLDICGVDLIAADISAPLSETGGGICELNAMPGLRPHLGDPRSPDSVGAILDSMMPGGGDRRIPIAAITGTNGKTTTALMVARIMRAAGAVTGVATTAGAWIDDDRILAVDAAGLAGARAVLCDPRVDVAILEAARGRIIREGLGFDRCTVGAVLGIDDDHLGEDGIHDRRGLARVKRLVAGVARDLAVLNAADPLCVEMRHGLAAQSIGWVALDAVDLPDASMRGASDLAVTVDGRGREPRVVVRIDGVTVPIAPVAAIPAADSGRARHGLLNALFATAIAWGLGAPAAAIGRGLAAFDRTLETTRGRMAAFDARGIRVLVDFAQNAGAIGALACHAAALPIDGRRILLLRAPGNRDEAHYAAMAAAAAATFDRFVCAGSDRSRRRGPAEVARRLADGLRAAGVDRERIETVPDETAAIAAALAMADVGDLVVLVTGAPEAAWAAARARIGAQ